MLRWGTARYMLFAAQERNAAIIRAEGESEAAKLISDATKTHGAGLLELRRIEVSECASTCECRHSSGLRHCVGSLGAI
jgi:hypothetical protein